LAALAPVSVVPPRPVVPLVPPLPGPLVRVAPAVVPARLLLEVVVAPLQEIRLIASASANAKLARAGAEEQARQMALLLPTTMALVLPTAEERFFAARPRGPEIWSEEKSHAATPLRMTASSDAARKARPRIVN